MNPTRSGTRRGRRASWWVVALGLLWAVWWPVVSPAAAAGAVAVEIRTATVTGTGADAAVAISGTVANTSGAALYDVQVHLWRSTAVLRSASVLDRSLGADGSPRGSWQALADSHTAVITAPDAAWGAGNTRIARVSGDLATLGITRTGASYWVGLTVTARAAPGAEPVEVGRDRTLLTLPDDAEDVALTSVVELSAPPRQIKQDLFVDDTLADDLQGRLATLVTAAADHDWVVDPALLAEVRDMADGYRVRTGPDSSEEGTRAALAQDWLDAYALLDPTRGRVGLFGTPDASLIDVVDASVAASERVDTGPLRPLVVLDAPSSTTLGALARLGRPVLATGIGADAATVVVDGTTVVPVISPSAMALPPDVSATPFNRAAVADALARAHGAQVRLLRTVDDVVVADAAPPWGTPVPLEGLLAVDPVEGAIASTSDAQRPFDDATLNRARSVVAGIEAYREAAPSADLAGLPDEVLARVASHWWSADRVAQQTWLDAVDARASWTALAQGLELAASARFSLAASSGDYPVTVTNRLVDPVIIRLVATTDNPQRIRFAPTQETTLAPGTSTALLLRAEASGGGVVNANVHVESVGGRRLTGDQTFVVETTNFGLIGWVLVIGSGIVLVTTTALRISQVRRAARAQKAGEHG